MTEPGTGIIREQVRDAYGALAVAAGLGNRISLSVADIRQSCFTPVEETSYCTPVQETSCGVAVQETSCCTPAETTSSCDSNPAVTAGFGSSLLPR